MATNLPRALFTVFALTLSTAPFPTFAGGYVDANAPLNPATSIPIVGTTQLLPTFNNDQFNDRLLVGTVNNDAIRTPSTADPISTVTGNNYHDETDFVIRGRNELNFVFTRTYNSAPSSTTVDRGLGFGWTHSYLMRLKSNDFSDCPNCTSAQKPENANNLTSSITYTDERGGEQNFLVNEASFAVTAPKGVYDTLTLDSPVVGQHTLAFRNGVKYIFEVPAGTLKSTPSLIARLKYIDNAWGDRLTLMYDVNGRLSTLTDNLGVAGRTGLVLTYDANGRLKDVTDWTARQWRFGYDTSGNLTSRTNPLTQVLTYAYDAPRHLLTSIVQPLARDGLPVKTAFDYYRNGRAFQQTNGLDQGDTLDYDLYRKSTRVTDPRGGIRQYFYDDNGRMTQLTEPDGGVLLFENQSDAIRSKKYDAQGYATTYSYRADKAFTGISDSFGNVTREQDALARTTDFTYGALDQIATVKDKRGTVSTTAYAASTTATASVCGDYLNRPKETRISALAGAANVLLASQCWNNNATLNYARQYLDATRYTETRLTYQTGSNGLNVSQQQMVGMPSGITVTQAFTYDTLGRKKTETLKRRTSPTVATLIDLTTSYDYDVLDRVTKVTDSLGNEVVNSFDANGQLWKVTHRYKKPDATFEVRDVVTRTFDAADRVKTETDADGGVTSYQYDPAGNVIAVSDAEGHTAKVEYDAMGRKTAVIDATGYRTETRYTLRGDVVSITNANNETVKFETDALGRKTAAIDPIGFRNEFSYDENGNLTCSIDANAQAGLQPKNSQTPACTETRQYDELNRLTKIIDAQNGETVFTYNLAGNRLTVKDAELKTHNFSYDDLGRLTSETDHAGKVTSYKPDEAGNVYETINRLTETARVIYDRANRATRVDYLKDASFETFGYDPAGTQANAVSGNIGYTFTWDSLNRLKSKLDSRGKSLGFTYDKVGNILTKTTYQGSTTRYLYNAANRLTQLINPDYLQVDYQYDPAGRLLSRVTSAGARTTSQFDANGWQTKLTQYDAANALISDTNYTRDRTGNILTQTAAAGATTYAYDPLYRLKTADLPGTINDELFTYDKVGNRKTATKGSLIANANTRYYNYTTGTNRLLDIRIGSAVGTLESGFTHDFEGRLTSQTGTGAKTFTWDAKSRIKTLTKSGTTETYGYDPIDHRIGRSGGALGSLDYFLEGEHLESIYSGVNLQAKYLRGSSIDELVAGYLYDTDAKLKPYLFHHDNVTSTTAVSGHNGGTIQSTTYSAFGSTLSTTGASPNRLKYTGREDDGNGCYYYRARYYCPDLGRFISEDPLGFEAGDVNFYAYVGNNPINANDPTGLLFFFTQNAISRNPIPNQDAARISNFTNAVALTGTAVASAPFTTVLGTGASAGSFAALSGSTALRTAFASGAIGGASGALTSLSLGGSAKDVAIAGGVGFAAGAAFPFLPGTSILANARNGSALGAASSFVGQSIDIFTDASKNFQNNFNFGELIGSTLGGGIASGLTASFGKSFAEQVSAGIFQFGPSTAGSAIGGALGASSSAGGGFLLYPNKANLNMTRAVYAK